MKEEHNCSYLDLNSMVVGKFNVWVCDVCGKEQTMYKTAGNRGVGGFSRQICPQAKSE